MLIPALVMGQGTTINSGILKSSVVGDEKIPVSGSGHPVISGNRLHTYHQARFDSVYVKIFNDARIKMFLGGTLFLDIFENSGDSYMSANGMAIIQSSVLSPAALSANTDDYAPTGIAKAVHLRVSSSAPVNLTGIAGGNTMVDGRVLVLTNVGSNAITLKNDVTSTAANRFKLNADFTLSPDMSVHLYYDGTSARWRKAY